MNRKFILCLLTAVFLSGLSFFTAWADPAPKLFKIPMLHHVEQPCTGKFENTVDQMQYYDDGNLYLKSNCLNGAINGLEQKFYPNGTLWIESQYKNGKLNGVLKEYSLNGKLTKIETYKDDLLDGQHVLYNEKGEMEVEESYVMGVLQVNQKREAEQQFKAVLDATKNPDRYIDQNKMKAMYKNWLKIKMSSGPAAVIVENGKKNQPPTRKDDSLHFLGEQ